MNTTTITTRVISTNLISNRTTTIIISLKTKFRITVNSIPEL